MEFFLSGWRIEEVNLGAVRSSRLFVSAQCGEEAKKEIA